VPGAYDVVFMGPGDITIGHVSYGYTLGSGDGYGYGAIHVVPGGGAPDLTFIVGPGTLNGQNVSWLAFYVNGVWSPLMAAGSALNAYVAGLSSSNQAAFMMASQVAFDTIGTANSTVSAPAPSDNGCNGATIAGAAGAGLAGCLNAAKSKGAQGLETCLGSISILAYCLVGTFACTGGVEVCGPNDAFQNETGQDQTGQEFDYPVGCGDLNAPDAQPAGEPICPD